MWKLLLAQEKAIVGTVIVKLSKSSRSVSSSTVAAHRAPSQQKSLSLTDIYCPAPHRAGRHQQQYSDYLIDTPDTIIHTPHTLSCVYLHPRNILTIINLDIEIMNKEMNDNIDIQNSTNMEKPTAVILD